MIPEPFKRNGPGKFSSNVEEAIHDIAIDSEGFGDVETFNYFGLVVFDAEELAALKRIGDGWDNVAAAITEETNTGAVSFHYFETEAEARAAFDAIRDEWNDAETEAEAEAERDRFVPGRDAFKAGE